MASNDTGPQFGPDRRSFEVWMLAREKYVIDPVTGILNRTGFLEETRAAISRSKHPENLAVIVLDLDRFKPLNDTQGHYTGDLALHATAEFLGEQLRESDLRAHTRGRVGGDEFCILADLTAREETTRQPKEQRLAIILERLASSYPEAMSRKNKLFGRLSLSAGGAFYDPELPLEETIKKADDEMYQQKHSTREIA
jgi:diguanylate cyclase (GGDEF)-like protein